MGRRTPAAEEVISMTHFPCVFIRPHSSVSLIVVITFNVTIAIKPLTIVIINFNSNLQLVGMNPRVGFAEARHRVFPPAAHQGGSIFPEIHLVQETVIPIRKQQPSRSVRIKLHSVEVVELSTELPDDVRHWEGEADVPVTVVLVRVAAGTEPQYL